MDQRIRGVVLCALTFAGCEGIAVSKQPIPPEQPVPTMTPVVEPQPEPVKAGEAFACADPTTATTGSRRIWRLTRTQYDNSIRQLLGTTKSFSDRLSGDVGQHLFLNSADGLRVRSTEASQFHDAAAELALEVSTTRFATIFPCGVGKGADATCQKNFVEGFGAKAFRRPLTSAEVTRYQTLFGALLTLKNEALAVQGVVEAMLQSPHFLFRTELGADGASAITTLTPNEVASAMSYSLTDSSPDADLMKAAADGTLLQSSTRVQQAERLLQTAQGNTTSLNFYRTWLRYQEIRQLDKDASVIANFAALRLKLADEMDLTMTDNIRNGDVSALLSSSSMFVSKDTAPFWNVTMTLTATPQRVTLDPTVRSGILTSPAVVSVLASTNRTSMVARGKFVREQLMCDAERDPPANADLSVPAPMAGVSRREQLSAKTSGQACASCHSLYNPIGFGMEELDAVGRFRTDDNLVTVDNSGALVDLAEVTGPFRGTAQLSQRLAQSATLKRCLSVQLFRYLEGRSENLNDSCALKDAHAHFEGDAFRLKHASAGLFSSPSFIQRRQE
jgi:Protein of unknown function (DUF1588)/Protein of unknown function (DUF1592)/Protein of unknown function (DUF1595)/Protein of unknown function (DUF1587)/Protein of unknown function (DUF1585)